MMAVTHALIGLMIGISGQWIWSELVFYAAIGAFAGGIFPDLDLAFNHRKTLHFPIGFTALTLVTGSTALINTSVLTVTAFYFLLSAAVHSTIDIFGGGLETRPWIPSDDRGVYSHTLDKWFSPKRWIRYDGSPEDFFLSFVISVPCYLFYTGILQDLVALMLIIGGIYTLLRKKVIEWAPERFL